VGCVEGGDSLVWRVESGEWRVELKSEMMTGESRKIQKNEDFC
jgi:hypothetical protein